jgi:pyrroloquinoline quinone (PQQ) biosynthesis protein C
MPRRYLAEMVADRVAACKIYEGENYTAESALRYLMRSKEKDLMNPQTRRELEYLLTMLRDDGEKETFRYIRQSVLKGKPFPWEQDSKN